MAISASGSLSVPLAILMFLASFGLKGKFGNYTHMSDLKWQRIV